MSGVTGREIPQVTSIPQVTISPQGGSYTVGNVLAESTARTPDFSEASMNFTTNLDVPTGAEESSSFLSRLGKTFDPGQSSINPRNMLIWKRFIAPEQDLIGFWCIKRIKFHVSIRSQLYTQV
jgi:hypothetical protein